MIRSAWREHVRRHDVALDLLQRGEGDQQPHRVERLAAEQRDQHRRGGADRRPDVGDQLGERVPGAEEQRVRLAVGEDPERPEDPQQDPRARAHDQREEQLAADVADHRALDARRVVVLRRPARARHDRAQVRADPLAVEQHVDADHDDQDQRQRRLDERAQRVLGERDELAGALGQVLAERAAAPSEPSSEICTSTPLSSSHCCTSSSVALASSTSVGTLSRNADTWSATGLASTRPIVPSTQTSAEHHDQHRDPARDARAAQQRDERVQQQRDEPADDEQQQHRAGGLEHAPQAEDRQRQEHELHPPGDDDTGVGRHDQSMVTER